MKREDLIKIIGIVIVVLLLIVIIIVAYLFTPYPSACRKINKINTMTEYQTGTVILNNTQEWSEKYKGSVSILSINATIDYFAKELIPEYRTIDLNNVEAYYNSNKKIIEVYTGIDNLGDFKEVVERAKELKGDELVLERAEYVKGSSRIRAREVNSVLALQYKGNDKILFNVSIKFAPEDNCTSVLFNAKVDETAFDTTRQELVDPQVDPSKHTGRVIR
jgi:hypothetical protein